MPSLCSVLVIENERPYVDALRNALQTSRLADKLSISFAHTHEEGLGAIQEGDIAVVVVDIALDGGKSAVDLVKTLWRRDKKVVYVFFTVSLQGSVPAMLHDTPIPLTAQFHVQKTGDASRDASRLATTLAHAVACYVPYMRPCLRSAAASLSGLRDLRSSIHNLRDGAIVDSLTWSQDVLNDWSVWCSDHVARRGYNSTRLSVVMTGSFARLEAHKASDADYFVLVNDEGADTSDLPDLLTAGYEVFLECGQRLKSKGIEVHSLDDPAKHPDKMVFHETTLPTWFTLSSFTAPHLGISSQLEATKLWFLLESSPIFNEDLYRTTSAKIASSLGLQSAATATSALSGSGIVESLTVLETSLQRRYRSRHSSEVILAAKQGLLRAVHLLGVRLTLLRYVLDARLRNATTDAMLAELQEHPLHRLQRMIAFLDDQTPFGAPLSKRLIKALDSICVRYVSGFAQLSDPSIHDAANGASSASRRKLSDLSQLAQDNMRTIERALSELANHNSIEAVPLHKRLLQGTVA